MASARGGSASEVEGRVALGRVQKSGREVGGERETNEARDGLRPGTEKSAAGGR